MSVEARRQLHQDYLLTRPVFNDLQMVKNTQPIFLMPLSRRGLPGRAGHTGENSPPSAPPTFRWARNVGQLEPTATRDSSTEPCWHAGALGGGSIWPSSTEPAPAPRSPSPLSPTGPPPRSTARILLSRAGWARPTAAVAPGGLSLCLGGTAGTRSGGLSHARRALLCREALTDAEPVLSTDVRLTRGRKRSERRLLLLQEELVIAKLQRGTTLRPQLRLALDQLWVLSGGQEAAGEEKEEEESGDEDILILAWPTGSCIVAFGSQALKELWVGTLLGTPEEAKRARVTRLPSLKPLEKELSRRHAGRTFSAGSLERLIEGQAEDHPKQGPPTAPSGNNADGLCRSPGEFWKERQPPANG
ncbi:uncharacterized protein LOC128150429 [Harpia harpyja]|uniref:uncharacterized protein LOC128150429 n=1 Tax=Harpia harpyja TaxID=202280 RepID=UPI0022B1313A|nr:uncharacterized protein LOC128150429 [Harpia harpyja]